MVTHAGTTLCDNQALNQTTNPPTVYGRFNVEVHKGSTVKLYERWCIYHHNLADLFRSF